MDMKQMTAEENVSAGFPSEKQAERESSGKKEKKKHGGRNKYALLQGAGVMILVLLLLACSGGLILYQRLTQSVYDYRSNMQGVLTNIQYGYRSETTRNKAYVRFEESERKVLTQIIGATFQKKGYSRQLFDNIQNLISNGTVFYFGEDSDQKTVNILTDEEMEKVRQSGYVYSGENLITGYSWEECDILVRWTPLEKLQSRDLFTYAGEGEQLQIVNLTSGRIIDSNCEGLTGTLYRNYHKTELRNRIIDFVINSKADSITCGVCRDGKGKLYYFEEDSSQDDNCLFAIHVPMSQIMQETLRSFLPQFFLMMLIFLMALGYSLHLRGRRWENGCAGENRKIAGRIRMDTNHMSHLTGFIVLGAILSLVLTLYLQLLIEFCTQNLRAGDDLKVAASFVETTLSDKADIENYYTDVCIEGMNVFAGILELDSEYLTDDALSLVADKLGASSITIYDSKGYSVVSSNGYTGYVVSTDPENAEYAGCRVLDDGISEIALKNEEDGTYCIAVRRKDSAGVITMMTDSKQLDQLTSDLSVKDAMTCTNFDQADKMFVILDEPDKTYWIQGGSFTVQELDLQMSDELLAGTFTGQIRLEGISYYVNELLTDNVLYISAMREDKHFYVYAVGLLIEAAGYLLLTLILSLLSMFVGDGETVSPDHSGDLSKGRLTDLSFEKITDSEFRKRVNRLLICTVLLLLAILLTEIGFYSSTVIRYLLSSNWERKLNLFSVTMILFSAVAIKIFVSLAAQLIMLVSRNMGSKGMTIGQMICSLLRFAAVMIWFIYTMVELGIRLAYLLTGAGVIGIVIGYACQGVINDLLSGLFIVFEGSFQVGDWVSVDGWRGEVRRIGIRTTQIICSDDMRIFNNSSLNTITVLGHTMSGALCRVSIDYSENVDRVLELIRSNQEGYRKACPQITEGPGIHGVTDLGDNGVTIQIWALVEDQKYMKTAERAMLKETKRLFDENGVTIPFPQIVLHEGK